MVPKEHWGPRACQWVSPLPNPFPLRESWKKQSHEKDCSSVSPTKGWFCMNKKKTVWVLVSHTCCPSRGFPWLRCVLGCSGPSLHTPHHTSPYPEPPCRHSHWSHKCTVEKQRRDHKEMWGIFMSKNRQMYRILWINAKLNMSVFIYLHKHRMWAVLWKIWHYVKGMFLA